MFNKMPTVRSLLDGGRGGHGTAAVAGRQLGRGRVLVQPAVATVGPMLPKAMQQTRSAGWLMLIKSFLGGIWRPGQCGWWRISSCWLQDASVGCWTMEVVLSGVARGQLVMKATVTKARSMMVLANRGRSDDGRRGGGWIGGQQLVLLATVPIPPSAAGAND